MKNIIIIAIVALIAIIAVVALVVVTINKRRQNNNCLYAKIMEQRKALENKASNEAHNIATRWANELIEKFTLQFAELSEDGIPANSANCVYLSLDRSMVFNFQSASGVNSMENLEQRILNDVNEILTILLYGRRNVKRKHHTLYINNEGDMSFTLSLYL